MSSPIGDDACAGSGTSDGNKAATCAAFARVALNTASDTVTGFPDEVSCPRWGQDTHQAKFTHQVLSHSPLACLADRQVEHGGDESTVNVGGKRLFRETSELRVKTVFQTEGPSYRHVVDLSSNDTHAARPSQGGSVFINPMGGQGNPLSEEYSNYLLAWGEGKYPLSMSLSDTVGKMESVRVIRAVPN